MRLIPTKKQWKSWSLPSKYATVALWLTILGIALTLFLYAVSLLLETRLSNSQVPKAREHFEAALEFKKEKDYQSFYVEAQRAYKLDSNNSDYRFALLESLLELEKIDEAYDLLIRNRKKLDVRSQWILGMVYFKRDQPEKAFQVMESINYNFKELPRSIRVEALTDYIKVAALADLEFGDEFLKVLQHIVYFVDSEIDQARDGLKSTEARLLTNEVTLGFSLDLDSLFYLPAVKFFGGVLLLQKVIHDKSDSYFMSALDYIDEGFVSILFHFDSGFFLNRSLFGEP